MSAADVSDPKPIVVVEEAFVSRGSGVLVMPRITFDDSTRAPFAVTLRSPSGEDRAAKAIFEVSHIRGSQAPFAMLRILELGPDDVPPGTAIFRDP